MDSNILIQAKDVGIQLGGRQVLKHVDLTLRKGELLTLIGPNGAGKTTLVRIVLGLMKAQQGSLRRAAGLRIGYMPQKVFVEPTLPLTVKRFIELGGAANSQKNSLSAESALAEVNVSHLLGQQVSALSGGEMQRVLLARALSQSPDMLVLDEPAQGVDISGQLELYELINGIRKAHNCGVLMVSHDLHLVMAATDQVICLNQHICCHGKPEQVSNDPAYLALFGRKEAETLAVYTHHHNHSHDIAGDVVRTHKHV
ncbi:zinc ABC transporter ATP-binding protein ZnuC [Pseudohongiella spirulinae]|uniref:Zinc ABC transporter ATPase n=1 Tax=Pseudohongiella spirulinae TaxID=1249552 RepID=A0A0S2K9S0_9GAMM|nr:zinc ABC transporter ATP-binding protein ZnuC [Pseudohongiella spirulinae]ALO44735.1 Zinc ABC transporter ATPase [Pseudohongiella spirulinae]